MITGYPPLLFAFISLQTALVVLAICVLLFGANKLPELMRSLGKSVTEFKKGINEGGKDEEEPPKKVEKSE